MATSASANHGNNPSQNTQSSSTSEPVELNDLSTSLNKESGAGTSGLLNDISIPETSPITSNYPSMNLPTEMRNEDQNTRPKGKQPAATSEAPPTSNLTSTSNNAPTSSTGSSNPPAAASSSSAIATSSGSQPSKSREDTVAIGPSTDSMPTTTPSADAGPAINITLLLTSGSRHPYKIDEKYLNKRGVTIPSSTESGKKDIFSISVYTLKELILREWREEWENKPSNPSYIRLIFFGRLLDDKSALKDCKLNAEGQNVVHMTVKPADLIEEDEGSKGATGRDRDGGEETAGCRCVIL